MKIHDDRFPSSAMTLQGLVAPVIAILLIFAGVTLTVILSGARFQDKFETGRSQEIAVSALRSVGSNLAYRAIGETRYSAFGNSQGNEPDSAWVRETFGGEFYNGPTAVKVIVLDSAGTSIFQSDTLSKKAMASDFSGLFETAQSLPLSPPDAARSFIELEGVVHLAVAIIIAPAESGEPASSYPVLVLARPLDDLLLRELSADFLLEDLKFERSGRVVDQVGIYLRDLRGETLGMLAWTPQRPGRELLLDIVVPILIATLLTGLLLSVFIRSAVLAARGIRRGNEALVERGEALELSENKLLAIIDGVADSIFSFDDQGVITSANDSAKRIFGYELEEMVGHPVGMLLADSVEESNVAMLAADASLVDMQYLELAGRRKDGTVLVIDAAVSHITYQSTAVAIAIMRDVTEHRQAEETLNLLSTGMILVNGDCQLVMANSSASRILDSKDGLVLAGGRIEARGQSQAEQFRKLVHDVCSGSIDGTETAVMTIDRGDDSRPLSIMAAPLQLSHGETGSPTVAIFVRDLEVRQSVPPETLSKLFGLTPAEARVVVELVKGKRLQEAADDLGISLNTVRNQLKQIFSKTSTGRQSELVSLVLSSTALLSETGVPVDDEPDEIRLTGS